MDGLHLQNILYSHNGKAGHLRRIRITSFLKKKTLGTGSSIFIRFGKKYFH